MRLEYARSAEPAADLSAEIWPADGGWSYRLSEQGGAELLRARLEPGSSPADDAREFE
jgi:hypothetical protein